MKYFVEEIQTYEDDTAAQIPFGPLEKSDAEEKYHICLAAAAVSTIPCHAVVMLDAEGRLIKREKYTHKEEQDGKTNND